jgi:hypothetical protein
MIKNLIRMKSGFSIMLIIMLWVVPFNYSQATNPVEEKTRLKSTDISVTVSGTSSLHDWEMKSEDAVSEVLFTFNDQGAPETMESATFRLKKTSLKSDKSGLDKRAYDAMNANRHPEIIFRTNKGGKLQKSGDNYLVDTGGELTIGGVTRQIEVSATCVNGDDTQLVCSGSKKLNMSNFDIDPPVMMLGALRTGDEITISYKIVYTP